MVDQITLYPDRRGRFRWRRVEPRTRNVVAESGQGYVRLPDCLHQLRRVNAEPYEIVEAPERPPLLKRLRPKRRG